MPKLFRPTARDVLSPDEDERYRKEHPVMEVDWRIIEITATPPCKFGNPSTPMRRASSLLHRFRYGPEELKRQVRRM